MQNDIDSTEKTQHFRTSEMLRFIFLFKKFLHPSHGFNCIFIGTECSKSEPAGAVLSEAFTRGSHYVDFFKDIVEEFPASHIVRTLEPYIR